MIVGRVPHLLGHRLVALALIVCSFACCCPERSFTGLFAAAPADLSAEPSAEPRQACCDGCCGAAESSALAGSQQQRSGESADERRPHDRRCLCDCCNKADFKAPPFKVACDRIGAPIAEPITVCAACASDCAVGALRIDDDIGKPPPRLLLLVSARLRV